MTSNPRLLVVKPQTLPVKFNKLKNNLSLSNAKLIKPQKINFESETKFNESFVSLLEKVCPKETSIQPDLLIQIKRILFILDKAIEKMNLVISFHLLLEDSGKLVKKYIKNEDECDFVLDILFDRLAVVKTHQTALPHASGSVIWKSLDRISYYSIVKKEENMLEKETRFDPHMAQVIDILWNNAEVRKYIAECKDVVQDPQALDFINCLVRLRNIIAERLLLNSAQEIARQKQLKMAYRSNMSLLKHIDEFSEQLYKQREEMNFELEKKRDIIEYYENRIEELKENFKVQAAKKVQDSERTMTSDTQESEFRQIDLSQDAKVATQQYNSMLEDHLAEEKILRAKRLKVEAQLAGWLTKYDTDIGEKQAELEAIQREFDKEKREMDELQDLFDEQDDEYTMLMAEKEEEEQRIFNERAMLFLMVRSARRIQRYWRAYRERKHSRKKKKSKKKEGGGGKKGGKREKKKKDERIDVRNVDPNAALASAFKGDILDDIKDENAFK